MAGAESIFIGLAKEQLGLILGIGVGEALAAALEPQAVAIRQAEYRGDPNVALDAKAAAVIVAEDVEAQPWGAEEAKNHGIDGERFGALVREAQTAPGVALLFELWRRKLIDDGTFTHGLRKAKLEGLWDGPLEGLRDVLLSPAELANARQQEFIGDGRLHDEGDKQGYTADRMDLLYKMAGLPPGVETGLEMLRRGIIDEATFRGIVAEGHTKTKYTDDLLALRQPILSAVEYATLHLKGWITVAEMDAGGALSGYSPEQMNLLYLGMGRPATVHQIHLGYARGAHLPGVANEEAAIRRSVAQSNVRTEYADLLYAQRYTYPSAFVLRGLTQSGALTGAEAEQVLLFSGWEPTLAAKVAAFWAGGTAGTGTDPHVSKAESQLWTALHKSYVAEESDAGVAQDNMSAIGVPATAQAQVLALWDRERALVRKQLSPAQLKKAWKAADLTTDEAVARLVAQGYNVTDANLYLNS